MESTLLLIADIATSMTSGVSTIAAKLLVFPFNIFLGIALITMGWGLVSKFFKRR